MAKFFVNNTFVTVDASVSTHKLIYHALSYQIKNWEAIKAKKVRENPANAYWASWNGTKSAYDMKAGKFMTGLLPEICKKLDKNGVNYEAYLSHDGLITPKIPKSITLSDGPTKSIALYDYQMRVVNDFFNRGNGRGIAKLATGAGKTECAIAITKLINKPTIFLTHRVNLLRQTAARFEKRIPALKGNAGIVGDGSHEFRTVTFATVQTLQSLIKDNLKAVANVLAKFEFLIIDEAHRSGASQFYDVANLCSGASFRLALTATPFMQENSADDLCLMGVTGPIFSEVSNEELILRGIMARPYFTFFEIDKPTNMKWIRKWFDIYDHGIVLNEYRNGVIAQQVSRLVKMGRKTLCIVERIPHGKILEKTMEKYGLNVPFVSGKCSPSTRERSLKKLANGSIDALISTNIFDEGIDVKEIDACVLGAGNKNPVALFQRIGRTVRKKEKDNYSIIIDFIDKQHPTLYKHSCMRYNIVKNEPGFVIL